MYLFCRLYFKGNPIHYKQLGSLGVAVSLVLLNLTACSPRLANKNAANRNLSALQADKSKQNSNSSSEASPSPSSTVSTAGASLKVITQTTASAPYTANQCLPIEFKLVDLSGNSVTTEKALSFSVSLSSASLSSLLATPSAVNFPYFGTDSTCLAAGTNLLSSSTPAVSEISSQIAAGTNSILLYAQLKKAESYTILPSVQAESTDLNTYTQESLTLTSGAASTDSVSLNIPSTSNTSIGATGSSSTIIRATVKDAFLNLASDRSVTLSIPTNGGSASSSTLTTDTLGNADFTITSSTTMGTYAFTATSGSTTSSAVNLTYTAGGVSSVSLSVKSGSSNSIVANGSSTTILQALTKDSNNNVVSGASVTLTIPSNGGTTTSPATTNSSGIAEFTLTSSTTSGTYAYTATSNSVTSASSSLTFTPGAVSSVTLSVKSGSSSSIVANGSSNTILQALTKDSNNNVVSGASVTLNIPTNGGSTTSPATTNSSGIAEFTLTSSTTSGTYSYTATSNSVTSASSSLTFTPGAVSSVTLSVKVPYSSSIVANGSSTTILQATASDANSNLVSGASVTLNIPTNGGSTTSPATTNSSGIAEFTLTSSTLAGSYSYTATANSVTSSAVSISFTAGAVTSVSLAVKSGSQSSITANGSSTTILQALTKDSNNNVVSGASVTLTIPSNGGTTTSPATTNSSGIAEFTLTSSTTSGTYSYTATSNSVTSASSSLTFTAGAVSALTLSVKSGSSSSIIANGSSTTILQALAKDSNNNLVPSASVTLNIPTNGGSTTSPATTNSSGIAEFTLISSTTLGSYAITATSNSITSSSVSIAYVVGPLSSIALAVKSGSSSTLEANGSTTTILQATATDASNHVLSGISVAINIPTNGGSTTSPATTDSSGIAEFTLTSSSTAGTYAYTTEATISSVTTTSNSISLTFSPVVSSVTLAIKSGSASQILNNGSATTLLQATVLDSSAQPISAKSVALNIPTGGGSTTTPVTTNASGIAEFTLTSSTSIGIYSYTATAGSITSSAVTVDITPCIGGPLTASPFGAGSGTSGDPYIICTATQLNQIGSSTTYNPKYFVQGANISLASYTGTAFNMIGPSTGFTGSYDGKNYSITNFTRTAANSQGTGLFRLMAGGTLRNINLTVGSAGINGGGSYSNIAALVGMFTGTSGTIENINVTLAGNISGSGFIGGILGQRSETNVVETPLSINNVTVTFTGSSSLVGNQNIGGIVGATTGGRVDISQCTVTGANAIGSGSNGSMYAGGVIGQANGPFVVEGCQSNVPIAIAYYGGGLVGAVVYGGNQNRPEFRLARINRSSSSGSVSFGLNNGGSLGGFIGYVYGNLLITDSYSTGSVSTSGTGMTYGGGFIGQGSATAFRSYSTGSVTGTISPKGGFSGGNSLTYSKQTYFNASSFWDTTSSTLSTSGAMGEVGKTTAQLKSQSTFEGWDFDTVWQISTGNYPTLRALSSSVSSPTLASLLANGTGTSGDPYLIATASDLNNMATAVRLYPSARSAYYRVTANIDMSGQAAPIIGDPLYPFTGNFDGNSKAITNLNYTSYTNRGFIGFFGALADSVTIQNLSLSIAGMQGTWAIGGLTPLLFTSVAASISGITVTHSAAINASGGATGGLIGLAINGSNTYFPTLSNTNVVLNANLSNGGTAGGLIGYARGINISDSSVTGSGSIAGCANLTASGTETTHAGGLVGYYQGTQTTSEVSITRSNAQINLTGKGLAGGFVGGTHYGIITQSFATGNVGMEGAGNGSMARGGFIGYWSATAIADAYARGNITGNTGTTGGFAGTLNNIQAGVINRVYSKGTTGGSINGGLFGSTPGNTGTTTVEYNSTWDTESSGRTTVSSNSPIYPTAGRTTTQMQTQSTFTNLGWDFDTIWEMPSGGGYPVLKTTYSPPALSTLLPNGSGTVGSPYLISSTTDLINMAKAVRYHSTARNAYYSLTASLDFTGLNAPVIGDPSAPFRGSFAGNSYSITGLDYSQSTGRAALGLFGYVDSGLSITNLTLTVSNLNGAHYVGMLVGVSAQAQSGSSTISGITATLTNNSSNSGVGVGGLIGMNRGNTITLSNSTVTLNGNLSGLNYTGGIAGYVDYTTISNVSVQGSGSVSGTSSVGGAFGQLGYYGGSATKVVSSVAVSGTTIVGGLAGYISNCSPSLSYSTGNVTGTGNYIGGFTGRGQATDSYATGNVVANSGANAGAFGGGDSTSGQVSSNVFATGSVTGTGTTKGGLYGLASYTTHAASFWDTTVSGLTTSSGGSGVVSKTTTQLKTQSTYTGWDFKSKWIMYPNSYPTLRWTYTQTLATLLPNGTGTSGDPYLLSSATDLINASVAVNNYSAARTAYYKLSGNIDLSSTGAAPSFGNSTTGFEGSFDGNNFSISGLDLSGSAGATYVGLFPYLSGTTVTIQNLTLNATSVAGDQYTGTLVGYSAVTTLNMSNIQVNVSGNFTATNGYSGGIIGYANSTNKTLTNIHFNIAGTLTGTGYVGGLIGGSAGAFNLSRCSATGSGSINISQGTTGGLIGYLGSSGTVSQCYTTLNITSSGMSGSTGSLIGYLAGPTVSDSYATGSITTTNGSNTAIGNIIGSATSGTLTRVYGAGALNTHASNTNVKCGIGGNSATINSAICDITTSGKAQTAYVVGATTAQMQTQALYANADWNFATTWTMPSGGGYPIFYWQSGAPTAPTTVAELLPNGAGTVGSPYQIASVSDWKKTQIALQLSASARTAYYLVTANLDFSSEPIFPALGSFSFPFQGVFDGGSGSTYQIIGAKLLVSNNGTSGGTGLFGVVSGAASLSNINTSVTFLTPALIAANNIGGIAGNIAGSTTLSNITLSLTGPITGGTAYSYVGGIAGKNAASGNASNLSVTIENSAFSTGQYFGGLFGYLDSTGARTISNSSVAINPTVTVSQNSGGAFGYVLVTTGTLTISGTTVTGSGAINSISTKAGGFIGSGNISGAYSLLISNSSSAINAVTATSQVGGFAGYLNNANSYTLSLTRVSSSVGTVTASSNGSYSGGLVGFSDTKIAYSRVASSSNVVGGSYAGGLIGLLSGSTSSISHAYARGSVTAATGSYSGGLIGSTGVGGSYLYASGAVTGAGTTKGALVGQVTGGTFTNSYFASDSGGIATSAAGTAATSTQITTTDSNADNIIDLFSAFSASGFWILTPGAYPTLN